MYNKILLLPGWQDSGPEHWQSRWEADFGYERVIQHDWHRPLRGDWIARLEDAVLSAVASTSESTPGSIPGASRDTAPITLVAHSLGCILVAAWASVSRNTHRVACALLVAPGDVEREDVHEMLPSWSPVARQYLPFPSQLVACRNDPYCSFERAKGFASSWGSDFVDFGDHGHINAESGLGAWSSGHQTLLKLQRNAVKVT